MSKINDDHWTLIFTYVFLRPRYSHPVRLGWLCVYTRTRRHGWGCLRWGCLIISLVFRVGGGRCLRFIVNLSTRRARRTGDRLDYVPVGVFLRANFMTEAYDQKKLIMQYKNWRFRVATIARHWQSNHKWDCNSRKKECNKKFTNLDHVRINFAINAKSYVVVLCGGEMSASTEESGNMDQRF